MSLILENYKRLIARVDDLCNTIAAALGKQITCSAGCSSCCKTITVFPVEAAAMCEALEKLPYSKAEDIRRHISEHVDKDCCPLLHQHHCLLYEARPIICRTHGLPIIYNANGLRQSDCCPHNLTHSDSLSGTSVVDLDKLNHLLVAVNRLFLAQSDSSESPERSTIAEIIARQPRTLYSKD